MKRFGWFLFLIFIGNCSFAYSEDYLYLNDGTTVHGTIVDQAPKKWVKLKTSDGNIIFYNMSDINFIKQSNVPLNQKSEHENYQMGSGEVEWWIPHYVTFNYGGLLSSTASGSANTEMLSGIWQPGSSWSFGGGWYWRSDSYDSVDWFLIFDNTLNFTNQSVAASHQNDSQFGGSANAFSNDLLAWFDALKFGAYLPKSDLFGYVKFGAGFGLWMNQGPNSVNDYEYYGLGLTYGLGVGFGRNVRIYAELNDENFLYLFNNTESNTYQPFAPGDSWNYVRLVFGIDGFLW